MALSSAAYGKYRSTSILTATPERLLIMLYDGLLQRIERARISINENRPAEAHESLVRCQEIVLELRNTLKMEYEISHALSQLYDWFYRRLLDANIQKSTQPLDEIQPRIAELREAWVQASIIARQENGNSADNA